MKSPNHIIGSYIFTGILSSLSGINPFETPIAMTTMTVAAILPDIDQPKSLVGKALWPISITINRNYGQRTITHSGLALITTTLTIGFIEHLISGSTKLTLVYCYSYLSHLILDMMTIGGVPLLYPFYKNAFVIPGNPAFRIRAGDTKGETVIFCFMLLAGVSLKPLFANGFWTSYNRLFGTMTHLAAEFQRSEDLLEVQYFGRLGTETFEGKGYCISASENRAVLLEEGMFRVLDRNNTVITRVIPSHSGRELKYETKRFVQVPVDSVNRWLSGKMLASLEISANREFRFHHDMVVSRQTYVKGQFLAAVWLEVIPELRPAIIMQDTFFEVMNPRILILSNQLKTLEQKQREQTREWQIHTHLLQATQKRALEEEDVVQQEQLYETYQQLLKAKPPKMELERIKALELEIEQLQQITRLKNQEQRILAEQKRMTPPPPSPTRLTGSFTFIKISV